MNSDKSSILRTAIRTRDLTTFIQTMEEIKDVNYVMDKVCEEGIKGSVLMSCCYYCNATFANILLSHPEIDINYVNENKVGALLICITNFCYRNIDTNETNNMFKLIEKLLKLGAKANQLNFKGNTPYSVAKAECRNFEIKNKLLELLEPYTSKQNRNFNY